jgi:hypothetical protein
MRVLVLGASLLACGFLSATAQAKISRTVVPIAPRYLTAGTGASPYEYRGTVPETDARFLPITYGLTSGRFSEWHQDPWLVPYQRSSFSTDFDGWSGKYRNRR